MQRNTYLGASQFAAAMGISPHSSRAELWRQMTGRTVFEGNDATRHGIECEPLAIAAYEAATGEIVTDQQRWYSLEFMGTHVDGIASGKVIEVKCPFASTYDDVPAHYMAQIQGQMVMNGANECRFVAWTPNELRVWKVEKSLDYFQWMRPMLADFWDMFERDIEPPRLKRKPTPMEIKTERLL